MPADFLTKWIDGKKLERSLRYATNSNQNITTDTEMIPISDIVNTDTMTPTTDTVTPTTVTDTYAPAPITDYSSAATSGSKATGHSAQYVPPKTVCSHAGSSHARGECSRPERMTGHV